MSGDRSPAPFGVALVPKEGPPPYPISRDERLPELAFIKWQSGRWLFSRGHLSCTYEVQGMARALFDIALFQSPIGTLPDDDDELSKLLRVDGAHWRALRRLGALGPLRNWAPVDCAGQVRLGHDVLTSTLLDVLERREVRDLRRNAQAEEKRLDRLREALRGRGLSEAVLADDVLVRRIDEWLVQTCHGNRTQAVLDRAVVHAQHLGWFAPPRRG